MPPGVLRRHPAVPHVRYINSTMQSECEQCSALGFFSVDTFSDLDWTSSLAQLAIFIDGGYAAKIAEQHLRIWVDYEKLSNAIRDRIAHSTQEPLDLLRTYFYDCLPYQSDPPTREEADRFGRKRRFFSGLRRLPKYSVREGRLAYRGDDARGAPIFQQKRVDLMIGLDVAGLAAKRAITHAAVLAGDSDLLPAFEAAQREGITVWLVHGPRGTYAGELWDLADDRLRFDERDFVNAIRRVRRE